MLPTRALRHVFSGVVRHRGDDYADTGAVQILAGSADQVAALVTGTTTYPVVIERSSNGTGTIFRASCTCPFYEDRRGPCRHIWATLRVAERAGHLFDERRHPLDRSPVVLELAEAVAEPNSSRPADTPEPEDTADAPTEDAQSPDVPPEPPPSHATPPVISPSVLFLSRIQQQLAQRDHPIETPFPYADATLMYVVDATASAAQGITVLHVMYQRRSRAGRVGTPKIARISPEDIAQAPPIDRRILALISGARRESSSNDGTPTDASRWNTVATAPPATFALPAPLAIEVLPFVARHARTWIKATPEGDVLPLTWDEGPPWRFQLTVEDTAAGFRLDGEFVRGDDRRLGLRQPHHILAGALIVSRGTLAQYESGGLDVFANQLRSTGSIEVASDQKPLLAQLVARTGIPAERVPETLRFTDLHVPPTPRLSIDQGDIPQQRWLAAHASFDYDGSRVGSFTEGTMVADAGRQRRIHRDVAREASSTARLAALGVRAVSQAGERLFEIPARDFTEIVRELIDEGWQVDADGRRYRASTSVHLSVASGIDWFDLTGQVEFGDTRIPITEVLAALAAKRATIRLGDGTIGVLPEEWLARYAPLASAGDVDGDHIRFTRQQATVLDALLASHHDDAIVTVDETFARVRQELATFERVESIHEPESFQGTLRPYQREALGWFAFLRRFGFGGCLADDMGLGKTIVVLALLERQRLQSIAEPEWARPSLVVVPRSLVSNWIAEAARFTPELRVLDYSHGTRATDAAEAMSRHDVALVTYGTMRRDIEVLTALQFHYVILDEAQAIKNASTASAKAARLLRSRHRLALSGTPVENHLGELWSLFEFLNPGVLGRASVFERATTMLSAGSDPEMAKVIARGLRPFVLRRTKQQVARDLPARTEQTIPCELSAKERSLYESLRRHYRLSLLHRIEQEGLAKSKMHVLEALLRLRQASCHPGLVEAARRSDSSAKFDVLVPRLQEVFAEGHKALVFSQFTSLLALLRKRLDEAGVVYEYLDGKTKDRAAPVERFQADPSVGVFLISLKAGGVGLNLTAAEYVFLLDPWWNPAVEAQAIDRAHRIGQTREVFAYRLIAKDTIEEKVLQLQQSKRSLADAVLSADAVGLRQLGREDLELLLS